MRFLSLICAGALVLLTDAFVLVGVSVNRSDTTEEIELTERELPLQVAGEDNTGVSLRLNHVESTRFAWSYLAEPDWFDQSSSRKLALTSVCR